MGSSYTYRELQLEDEVRHLRDAIREREETIRRLEEKLRWTREEADRQELAFEERIRRAQERRRQYAADFGGFPAELIED
jgi:predicted  nucleic acid-binding Zn-ribbon protein